MSSINFNSHMLDSKKPSSAPETRQPSRLRWFLSSVVLVLLIARVTVHFSNSSESEYTLCSEANNIYTVDPARPRAQCLLVRGDRIAGVGNLDAIQELHRRTPSWVSRILSTINGNVHYISSSSIIVPGLAEQGYKMQLQLDGAKSVQEVVERIKAYIYSHPDVETDSNAADLSNDPLLRGRPILLGRVDGHASWVSERVLELMAPIPPDSEIDGGKIIRDSTGTPTDYAMNLIPRPSWSPEQYTEFFNAAIAEALKYGLTSVHDAATDPGAVSFFKGFGIRLYLMASPFSENFTGWEPSQIERLENYGVDGRLNLRSVKLYTDGALGSWGAALLEPYTDKPDTRGIMRSSPDTMSGLIRSSWQTGLQVNVHCIGDRANKVVLDVFEDLLKGKNATEFRPRIEHAQILQPADLERIGKLGVIASVQPTHATSDMWYAETRLGPERVKGAYAYRTLLNGSPNNVLPLGSDFPIENVNPLLGFYAATSRLSVSGDSPHGAGGWFPAERLTRAQALRGMTIDAAYASFAENDLGSLTIGKKASLSGLTIQ
ncbi:amidohydrolase family-domain-containing protein [Mycena rebaudengoi]|nr:amidohydrolase family-domain-containing protein [Mycena rebaudengoi]